MKAFILSLVLSGTAFAQATCPGADADINVWFKYLGDQSYFLDSQTNYEYIVDCLEKNEERLRQLGINECMDRLSKYAKHRVGLGEKSMMGLKVTDWEYYKTRPKSTQLPPEFKNGLPEKWKELVAEKGWPYLIYSSGTVANPPYSSFGRLLIMVPGKDHDQWLQFTYPDETIEGEQYHQTMIDTITMEKGTGDPKIHFVQYVRDKDGKSPLPRIKGGPNERTDQCYSCHPNGMREIIPRAGTLEAVGMVKGDPASAKSMSGEELAKFRLAQFNQRMQDYGQTDWQADTLMDASEFGPPFGSGQCTGCHDGKTRGAMNLDMNMFHVQYKVVVEKSMPPGADLTDEERMALVEDLKKKYRKDLEAWFARPDCRPKLGELKCDNPLKNRSIARMLVGRPQDEIKVETITKILKGKHESYASLLFYARHCDLKKIMESDREGKGTPGAPENEGKTPSQEKTKRK